MGFTGHAFVDWDDTIAENIRYFREVEAQISLLIAGRTGFDRDEVQRRGAELDVAVARQMGLVRESLAVAWLTCYREFAGRAGRPVDPVVEAELRRLCAIPYETRQELLPGAAETLRWLHEAGFEVTIWTAGEDAVQRRKIQESGLTRWIHRQTVVPEKTAERLRDAIGDRDPGRCFVVGNSRHSDIRPALTLGVAAYHVDVETWAYDHLDVDEEDPNYHRLTHIGELPRLLAQRFRLAV